VIVNKTEWRGSEESTTKKAINFSMKRRRVKRNLENFGWVIDSPISMGFSVDWKTAADDN
jgi:hypothetical protein